MEKRWKEEFKNVYISFISLERIQSSHQAAEREKQRKMFSYAAHTWKKRFSHWDCPQRSVDPKSRLILDLSLWTVKDYFASGEMMSGLIGQEAIRAIVFCKGGTADLGQLEGGLS